MRARVRRWGNSASVRIPASVLSAAGLSLDQAVDIREEGGRVVIEPLQELTFDLDDLLDRMTPETFPDEADFGAPAGEEAW